MVASVPSDYQTLLDQIRVRVPGALDSAILLELGAVLLDFFDTTNCWTEDLSVITAANITDYFLPLPSMGVVKRLIGVVDAVSCVPWRNVMYVPDESKIIFAYSPNSSTNLSVIATVAIIPDIRIPLNIPVWVWSQYRNGLVDGVLARMFSQLARPYSSPPLAKLHYGQYVMMCSQARTEASHKGNYRGQAWRFPTFSSARRRYR